MRGGAGLAIELDTGETRRLLTCAAPRGLALDGGALHVACADGTLDRLDVWTGSMSGPARGPGD